MNAAVIGCGNRGNDHVWGFFFQDQIDKIAVVDLNAQLARDKAGHIGERGVAYDDIDTMLKDFRPDVVAVCTTPAYRLEPIRKCVDAEVCAIQCEKPIATNWREAKALHDLCAGANVRLTFCHQRRFAPQFVEAKCLLAEGVIGEVRSFEAACPDLFDWGTHWLDMILSFHDQTPVEWILATFERRHDHRVFGAAVEDLGVVRFRFTDGVDATLRTEHGAKKTLIRVVGTDGMLEVYAGGEVTLCYMSVAEIGWIVPKLPPEQRDNLNPTGQSIAELLSSLENGEKPRHDSSHALQATELIFAALKSWRDGGRVALPLGNDEDIQLEAIMGNVQE